MASIPKQPFTLPAATFTQARFRQRMMTMSSSHAPTATSLMPNDLTLEGVASRQQTILDQLAFVLAEQENCSNGMKVLEDKVITKDALEDIIGKRLWTKDDWMAQRTRDEARFEPMMKQQVTRRWLTWMLAGFGCCATIAILLSSLLAGGLVILWLHLFGL